MMFYSKNSGSKVIHNNHCSYFKRMNHKNIGTFVSIEEARGAGYHLCKHCAPMWRYYSKEYYRIKAYAAKKGMALDYVDGEIIVQTPYSSWKIIVNGQKNHIFLYHKNTYGRCPNKRDLVPGYHSQSVRRSTLMEYLEYIAEHDAYRLKHPEIEKYTAEAQSQKGTTRKKQKTRKGKKREHYQSMMRVLALLENEANYRQMQAAK